MSALTCDICGGNLAMNESGDFAVCESCGMKHTKERVKVKVQEIKGVVEITKGKAEKERLLKNAETFLSLADIPKALEIYKQIANDYPNEVKSWIGIAECCFLRLPKQYEEGELTKAGTEISSIYFELLEAQKKAVILDATCQNKFDALWKKHQEKVENYTLELIDRYQNNDCLEDVLLELVKPNCYIPMSKQKLLSQLKENAMRLENEIRNPQCFKRIYEVGIARAKSYRFGLEDIVQSPVEHIEYLASREAIVSFSHYGGKTFNYICFNEPYSVEILAAKMMAPTDAENKRIKNLNLLKQFLDNIPNICDFIREFGYKTKENDSFKTTFDIYNVHIKMNKDVTTDEPSLTIIYDYSVNEYCKITKRAKIGTHQKIEKTYMGSVEEINSIKAFCKKKNLCVHCGGKFKGIFNKVCSKCGNPQDY